MGPSGSGKSTLLQVLGGLDRPTTGEVVLEGQTISQLSDDEATRLRRDRTGFVFQSFNLIPLLDATENVALPFTIAGEDPTRGELRERIRDVIALVDLTGKEHHKPDQLSAGEQQRVAIARALVTRPALLFADEPTGNLDYTTGTEILDALWRSCVERGQTIVLVTHDSKAAAYADRVLVIGDGQIRDTIELGRRDIARRDAADRAARPARPVGPPPMSLDPPRLPQPAGSPAARDPERARGRARRRRPVRRPRHERRHRGVDRSTVRDLVGRADLRVAAFGETGLSAPRPSQAIADTPGVAVAAPALERRTYLGAESTLGAGPAAAGHGPRHRPDRRRASSTTSPSSPARALRDPTSPARSSPSASPRRTAWPLGSPITMQGAGDRRHATASSASSPATGR